LLLGRRALSSSSISSFLPPPPVLPDDAADDDDMRRHLCLALAAPTYGRRCPRFIAASVMKARVRPPPRPPLLPPGTTSVDDEDTRNVVVGPLDLPV